MDLVSALLPFTRSGEDDEDGQGTSSSTWGSLDDDVYSCTRDLSSIVFCFPFVTRGNEGAHPLSLITLRSRSPCLTQCHDVMLTPAVGV